MTLWSSRPFEELQAATTPLKVHTLVVGSGYGAAFATLALALRKQKAYPNGQILVLERGKELVPGDFPKTIADLPAHVSVQGAKAQRTGYADSLFDVRVGENVSCIVGSGLGGTSLINANVAVPPTDEELQGWPPAPEGTRKWSAELRASVKFAMELLSVRPHPRAAALPKVQALKQLSTHIAGSNHAIADIAVNFANGPNAVGLEQKACTDCGNCFTGCNIGAKNTLAVNAWPLARSLGVDIVTGGTVAELQRTADANHPWRVNAYRTADPGRSVTSILATRVILAAGTFGSTEILQRSQNIGVSSCIGERFSLNGDGIAFGFGQRKSVNSHALVPSDKDVLPQATERPGPTIVSMIRTRRADWRGLIEDATVPQAIVRIWGEALTTLAMTRAYVSDDASAWHVDNPQVDRLATTDRLLGHHQVVLAMGTDDALGTIKVNGCGATPCWPKSSDDGDPARAARALDETLGKAAAGFDGGLYLSNPFWKPLPAEAEQVFEGASALGGAHVCNHPLGGCAMSADARNGVVNTSGQVFSACTGSAVHAGLYVLDGSIIPGALGINPFVTIAALAHRLAARIDGAEVAEQFVVPRIARPPALPIKKGQNVDWPLGPRPFVFRERLFGPASDAEAKKIARTLGMPAGQPNSFVMDAQIDFPSIEAWAADPQQQLGARFTLYVNDAPADTIDTIDDSKLNRIGAGTGSVRLFARDAKLGKLEIWSRASSAVGRFLQLRGSEIFGSKAAGTGWWEKLEAFARVARQHAHWRYLDYSAKLHVAGQPVTVRGTKKLAYAKGRKPPDDSNLWATLTNIELHFADSAKRRGAGIFRVDLVRMAKDLNPLQVMGHAETPQVALSAMAAGALTLRSLVQTHLWSFGAPSYEKLPTQVQANAPRLADPPKTIEYREGSKKLKFDCAVATNGDGTWRLLRAQPQQRSKDSPILLIHGMAHSSRVFYTATVDRSLAGFLLKQGYEVWMIDHGLSTALTFPAGYDPSIDEIAVQVTRALQHVYRATADYRKPGNAVKVFSHCVGSAATTMSILSGRSYSDDGKPLIESLVMHAVPPWIQPSESNLLRAYIGVFFKDRFFPERIDPIPHRTDTSVLLDRLAGSIGWPDEDFALHTRDRDNAFSRTLCNRMTAFYGYEWAHANLDRRTHLHIAELVGPASVTAFRHLYFLLNRRRVTDREGRNVYVRIDRFEHWNFPTLFLHGTQNKVFDAESSCLSAHQLHAIASDFGNRPAPRFKVGYHPVEGYGHMDVLFGKTAADGPFKRIAEHFEEPRNEMGARPKTSPLAPRTVQSGPIISRPQRRDGKLWLRVWCETNEFQTSMVQDIELQCDSFTNQKLPGEWDVRDGLGQRKDDERWNALQNSLFWIGDFCCHDVASPVFPVVTLTDGGIKDPPHARRPPADVSPVQWHDLPWFVRARNASHAGRLAFVCGSCWYPGTWFDREVADRVFCKIRSHAIDEYGIDHVLLLGDQIYADATASIFDIAEHRERYQESYRKAFNSANASWVLKHVPSYFVVDDHEFRDQFPARAHGETPQHFAELLRCAREEAWNFQMHHAAGPNAPHPPLYYDFASAGVRFFALDTRSERDPTKTGLDRLMSPAQQAMFAAWLDAAAIDEPLFIAMGSPPTPLTADEVRSPELARSSDTIRAFPELIAFIADRARGLQRRIVLLSGDAHYSSFTEFAVRRAGVTLASFVSIVSSGINAPLPFANARVDEVDWHGPPKEYRPPGSDIALSVSRWLPLSASRAHVLRVDLRHVDNQWRLAVAVIDADSPAPSTEVETTL